MISTRRTLRALAALLPLGALGISTALAATPAKPLSVAPGGDAAERDVAARLAAIREAVSDVTAEQTGLEPEDPNIMKAWWGNWWRPRWGNWGWRNGGWPNWRNGWGNGWPNWPNHWRNW